MRRGVGGIVIPEEMPASATPGTSAGEGFPPGGEVRARLRAPGGRGNPLRPLPWLLVLPVFFVPCTARVEAHDPDLSAVASYTEILAGNPDDLEALRARGSTYRALELFDNALEDLERADRLAPGDPEVVAEIGMCRFCLGELDRAREVMDRAARLLEEKIASGEWPRERYAPVERELRAYRFRNFRELGLFEETLAEGRRLEPYLSGKPGYFCDMGEVLLALGRPEAALPWFRRAMEGNPAFERYCVGAANCCLRLGRPEEALEVLRKWRAEAPDAAVALLHEAAVLGGWLHDAAGAAADLERAEAIFRSRAAVEDPDPEDAVLLARVLQARGRWEESYRLLKGLMDTLRGHWVVVHLQARNAAALGRPREARSLEKEAALYRRLNPMDWLTLHEILPPEGRPGGVAAAGGEEGGRGKEAPPSGGPAPADYVAVLLPAAGAAAGFLWLLRRRRRRG